MKREFALVVVVVVILNSLLMCVVRGETRSGYLVWGRRWSKRCGCMSTVKGTPRLGCDELVRVGGNDGVSRWETKKRFVLLGSFGGDMD